MFGESKIIIISPLSPRLIVTDKAIDGSERGTGAVHILILEELIQAEALLLGLGLEADTAGLQQTHGGLVLLELTCSSPALLAADLLERVPCHRLGRCHSGSNAATLTFFILRASSTSRVFLKKFTILSIGAIKAYIVAT